MASWNFPKKRTKLNILSTFSTEDSELHSFFGRIQDVNFFLDLLPFILHQETFFLRAVFWIDVFQNFLLKSDCLICNVRKFHYLKVLLDIYLQKMC